MKHLITTLIFISITILLRAQELSEYESSKLNSIVSSNFDSTAPGGAFSIIKSGVVVYEQIIGMANAEYKIPITKDSKFNIASNSKQFTTILALQLETEGKLKMTDDIRDYLPELANLSQKITLKQLTNHTHGLPNVDEIAMLLGHDRLTHDEVLEMLFSLKQFNFLPGDNYDYNNTGYVLLSEIIERVGGQPFEKQLQEKIFDKLGMKSQAVGNYRQIIPGKAYSYVPSSDGYVNQPTNASTMGASGIYASIDDLTLWAQNFQNPDNVFAPYFRRMEENTTLNSGRVIEYGMGLQTENYKGIDIVFHGGGTEGYRSYMLHVPDQELSLVFLSNQGGFAGMDIIYSSLEILANGLVIEKTEYKVERLSKFEGVYELNPGNFYRIIAENDSLFLQGYGAPGMSHLPQLSDNSFLLPDLPYARLIFSDDKFELRFADFTYPAHRVAPPVEEVLELQKFVGTFRNEAFGLTMEIELRNDQPVVLLMGNEYNLKPYSDTCLYAENSPFGKIELLQDQSGNITGLNLSRARISNLTFLKK